MVLRAFPLAGEERLVARLRQRDPEALLRFYHGYKLNVYRFALRIVRNSHVAEDVVQETFHRIWMSADRIRDDVRSLEPWIFTIARNKSLDYLRSPHGPERHCGLDAVPAERFLIEADPENTLASREEQDRIQRAFARLNARHKQVLEMAFYRDLTQSQIAKILRLPLGTVKTWTRNGLRELRRNVRTNNPRIARTVEYYSAGRANRG